MIIAILLILTQHGQIMTTIAHRILKFESMIKKPIMANYALFSIVTFSKFNSNTSFITSNLQKDFHQDNLSFACSQIYKHNCLNILASNICFHMQVKNQ